MIFSTVLALALAGSSATTCDLARVRYQALSFEEALTLTDMVLTRNSARPLACLEVKALSLLVTRRIKEARSVLFELFERAPQYQVLDDALSPGLRETIDGVREIARPLEVSVRAGWLVHESLRMDFLLEGGTRGARRIRYHTVIEPSLETYQSEVLLIGPAATATVGVAAGVGADRIRVSGQVIDDAGRNVHQFTLERLLLERPLSETVIVEVDKGGMGWPVWLALGLGVIGAGVVIGVLAQPDLPDADGTIGRVSVDQ